MEVGGSCFSARRLLLAKYVIDRSPNCDTIVYTMRMGLSTKAFLKTKGWRAWLALGVAAGVIVGAVVFAISLGNLRSASLTAAVTGDRAPSASLLNRAVNLRGGGGIFSRTDYMLEGKPSGLAIGDFDNDGNLDIAVASPETNDVTIFLGDGKGSFKEAERIPLGLRPASIAVGDFNGDGIPDMAITNYHSGEISMLIGNGDGTFRRGRSVYTRPYSYAIAAASLRSNGFVDLVVANAGTIPSPGNTISVFFGNGKGEFTDAGSITVGRAPISLKVYDINKDGRADIIVANNRSDDISIVLGDGDGTFQDAINIYTGSLPNAVAIGDFDGSGLPSIAVANAGSDSVGIVGRVGSKNDFVLSRTIQVGGRAPGSLVVGNFTNNGLLDILTANTYSDNLSFLRGNGDGTFQDGEVFAVGGFPTSINTADFNGDGLPDAVVANYSSSSISVFINTGGR